MPIQACIEKSEPLMSEVFDLLVDVVGEPGPLTVVVVVVSVVTVAETV